MDNRKHLIKVSNLPSQIDEETIRTIFSFIGEVAQVKLLASLPGNGAKEAYVNFKTLKAAELSTFLASSELGGKKFEVLLMKPETMTSSNIEKLFPTVAPGGGIISASYYANPQGHIGGPIVAGTPQIGSTYGIIPGYIGGVMGAAASYTIPLANPSVVAQMSAAPRQLEPIPDSIKSVIDPAILMHDPVKAEEIARTVYIGNISSQISDQELMDFFSCAGDVAYVKMAGDGMQPTRFAFIEFATIASSQTAMAMSGVVLAGRPLKINFSKNAINKPPRPGVPMVTSVDYTKNLPSTKQHSLSLSPTTGSTNDANPEEDAMKKLKEAQNKLLMKYSNSRASSDNKSSDSRRSRNSIRPRSRSRSVSSSRSGARYKTRDRDRSRDRGRGRDRDRDRDLERRRYRDREGGTYREKSRSRERAGRRDKERDRDRDRGRGRGRERERERGAEKESREHDRDRDRVRK